MTAVGSRAWLGRAVLAMVAAVATNASLTALTIEHDAILVTLLAVAIVAAGALALEAMEALETGDHPPWTVVRADARPASGEDTRTMMFRHLVEAHLSSHDADDAVVWQLADLASRRLRQVHGLRYAEDPDRVSELLGPLLADWISRDRRHRYHPDHRHTRYTVAQLGDVVRRIEEL